VLFVCCFFCFFCIGTDGKGLRKGLDILMEGWNSVQVVSSFSGLAGQVA
jgi:hypothetical protein